MANEIKRLVAYKTKISSLINGKYFKEEGWASNYVLAGDNTKLSRVNIIGIVVAKNTDQNNKYSEVLIDDSSAKIGLRSFEKNAALENAKIGDIVLVIGRPREFGNEKYILVEILKTLNDKDWLELRRLELGLEEKSKEISEDDAEEVIMDDVEKMPGDSQTDVIGIIKKLDTGDGADYDEVVRNSKNSSCDDIISHLLKQGDIFEIRAGKLKVLE
ncbi:MAG: OB-fold nucleic acid binding domain-containing protein [Candidatus Woesearchaeota archaeon]|nr:OB-fold nucleic acid binding domain-containing protein [Candidatus Woesearchaeota archaeon]